MRWIATQRRGIVGSGRCVQPQAVPTGPGSIVPMPGCGKQHAGPQCDSLRSQLSIQLSRNSCLSLVAWQGSPRMRIGILRVVGCALVFHFVFRRALLAIERLQAWVQNVSGGASVSKSRSHGTLRQSCGVDSLALVDCPCCQSNKPWNQLAQPAEATCNAMIRPSDQTVA